MRYIATITGEYEPDHTTILGGGPKAVVNISDTAALGMVELSAAGRRGAVSGAGGARCRPRADPGRRLPDAAAGSAPIP